MTQPTKGPWKAGPRNTFDSIPIYCENPSIPPLAYVVKLVDNDTQRANAAFIVRACNSHEELLEALRHVEENLSQQSEETFEHELAHIRHALARAEGRS